jgi:hypothetical protein
LKNGDRIIDVGWPDKSDARNHAGIASEGGVGVVPLNETVESEVLARSLGA